MTQERPKKRVAILGSTGSIGVQSLDVIKRHPEAFEVEVLTAQNNADLLIRQALEFIPNAVVIGNESLYQQVADALLPKDIKVFAGLDALSQIVQMDTIDMVLTALVGYSGLKPTMNAIAAGKPIALANKETMVVAGELITKMAQEKAVNIFPIDSEHSAIFQCIVGEFHNPIEKIILTASGGPFRGKTRSELLKVTKEMALKHPNWDMGAKITIDSASLMNKGLEVIEARWLFGIPADKIDVVVHPQSIVHSMVQFEDGSIKAQLGLPDMRIPIQFALTYPERLKSDFPRFNFAEYPSLTFEKPDLETFRNLQLSFDALKEGGNKPCVLNAANEVAVESFLNDKIGFMEMSDIVEKCLVKIPYISSPDYQDYVDTDTETRNIALDLIA
ncbi:MULTISPECIES: 1-deoxy-D-xylulose-5-phosphate reductoisomerase [unclassified Imperialibacter]|uniref:1-deoxy-D-xylulose-5-phosphate reductoisomerase n=1 Tax=unclassified Imperialibacter TaxID=2629706 RepID=UPI0012593380|nr:MULTISPECIES: 1-deoxy-D-xylulose-5-phosphate reductoisomerase [unclassified Imperialibacter]CAD5273150.1 1-deoxy-D-xylulose 5-phosphate reductoisomerase [Imperialibacter sp. 89]CAD5288818.1 1-deoxy-D-xylulose 5-phosphate reductoisomerase [Imperialibacter sp. 75]VVT14468.1 1-deoxy-D-xylulose 5-phosphate reductoisomerase [Imperialibacter sp. EC-SDR9]